MPRRWRRRGDNTQAYLGRSGFGRLAKAPNPTPWRRKRGIPLVMVGKKAIARLAKSSPVESRGWWHNALREKDRYARLRRKKGGVRMETGE
jgi:hypothetical protein